MTAVRTCFYKLFQGSGETGDTTRETAMTNNTLNSALKILL